MLSRYKKLLFFRNRCASVSADPGSSDSFAVPDSADSAGFGFADSDCSDSGSAGFGSACSDCSCFLPTECSAAFQKFLGSAASSVATHRKYGALLFCTDNAPVYIENTKAHCTKAKPVRADSISKWNNPIHPYRVLYLKSSRKQIPPPLRRVPNTARAAKSKLLQKYRCNTYTKSRCRRRCPLTNAFFRAIESQ